MFCGFYLVPLHREVELPGGAQLLLRRAGHMVKAPRDCIDYVILHELCHLAEHNHGERFYRLLSQVMPGWETIKQRLDAAASHLLLV